MEPEDIRTRLAPPDQAELGDPGEVLEGDEGPAEYPPISTKAGDGHGAEGLKHPLAVALLTDSAPLLHFLTELIGGGVGVDSGNKFELPTHLRYAEPLDLLGSRHYRLFLTLT